MNEGVLHSSIGRYGRELRPDRGGKARRRELPIKRHRKWPISVEGGYVALLMSPTECVTEQTIRENITRAVSDVFATMLGHHPRLLEDQTEALGQSWPPLVAKNEPAHTPHVVGTVGFIGEAN